MDECTCVRRQAISVKDADSPSRCSADQLIRQRIDGIARVVLTVCYTLVMKESDSDVDECDSEIATYSQDFIIHYRAHGGGNVADTVAMGELDVIDLREESVRAEADVFRLIK